MYVRPLMLGSTDHTTSCFAMQLWSIPSAVADVAIVIGMTLVV